MSTLDSISFLYPSYFWLLIPGFLLCALSFLRKTRNIFVTLLRLSVLLLLICALARPIQSESKESLSYTALFDVSSSISKTGGDAFLDALETFLHSAEAGVKLIPFARTSARQILEAADADEIQDLKSDISSLSSKAGPGETNIEFAIRTALNDSEVSSILLLSDGFETAGDAREAARSAASVGAAIYPLVIDDSLLRSPRLSISSLHAPITAAASDRTTVRLSVKNSFSDPKEGTLNVWLDDKSLRSERISVPGNQEKLFEIETPTLEGGLKRVRAELRPERGAGEEHQRHRWLSVKEKAKILLLHGAASDQRVINEVIRFKGYSVEEIVADGRKNIPRAFKGFSSIILNNIAKHQLPSGFLDALKTFAESGGGVLLIGGDRSFGLGKYINTPLETISPLKFVPPKTQKKRLRVGVVLVVDKSGSMNQQNKIDAAREAALMSINSLKNEDYISVIAFDHAPFEVIELETVREVKKIAQRRLRNLTAAGQTNLLPAIALARQKLRRIKAGRKHMIILSDGRFPLSSSAYVSELNRLRNDGVTISTIALGSEADVPFMKFLSQQGRGAFYHTLDPSRLPKIFVEDIKVATGEETLQEDQQFPVGEGPGGLHSTNVSRYRPLLGFVETLPKKGSRLELITRKDRKVFPIFASWRFGKGRVAAFTSDANGRWSSPWVRWPDFTRFWGEIIESVRTKNDANAGDIDFDLRYSVNRKSLFLELSIFDPNLDSAAAPIITAEVIEPGGELKQAAFRGAAKGRFETRIDNARPGDYRLNISYGSLELPPMAVTITPESLGENQGRGIHLQNLEEIAYLSGGAINPDSQLVKGRVRKIEKRDEIYTPLALAAFLLVLLEAFIRELGFLRFTRKRKDDKIQEKSKAIGAYHYTQRKHRG